MSSIEFQNGFLVGLAVTYKKAREGVGFDFFTFRIVADSIHLGGFLISATDVTSVIAEHPIQIGLSENLILEPILCTDSISIL